MEKMGEEKVKLVGHYAALLSIMEIGLGSFLHALHIPFSGSFLSLNQGALLCRLTREAQKMRGAALLPLAVSNVAALLKSLSPAGKKLGPMLSLSMQGLLFSLGPLFLGMNFIGACLGMLLLSLWTFIQPLITYYMFFGSSLFQAIEYLAQKILPMQGVEALLWLLLGVVMAKLILALVLVVFTWRGGLKLQDRILQLAEKKGLAEFGKAEPRRSPLISSLKDLTRPLFLVSFVLTGFFLIISRQNDERILWFLLRPLAVAFLFFYFSRVVRWNWLLQRLYGTRWDGFARSFEQALHELKGQQQR